MQSEHLFNGESNGKLMSAKNLADWRNAFTIAGFSDKEALRLVRDVWKRSCHLSVRMLDTEERTPEETT